MIEIIKEIILPGALAGLGGALVGFVKSIPDGETFDMNKATPILIIGAIAGGYAAFNGVTIATAYDFIAVSGIGLMLNYVYKAIMKFYNNKSVTGNFINPKK